MADASSPTTFAAMYADARARLPALCAKARRLPGADVRYIDDLTDDWDKILARREAAPSAAATMPEPAYEAYRFLAGNIDSPRLDPDSPDLDDDALLAWVDAFPDAVDHLGREWEEYAAGSGQA